MGLRPIVHIVDDDASVRAFTSHLLHDRGYATQIYSDGREFLENARLEAGCILLDLRMPGLSGLEVLEELNKRKVSLPLIMFSGHADVETAVDAMRGGALTFIKKPFQEQALITALEEALQQWEKRQQSEERAREARRKVATLSERETQVLRGLLAGMSNKEIASQLGLSTRTVEMHRGNAMGRLRASGLSATVRIALDAGLEPLSSAAEKT